MTRTNRILQFPLLAGVLLATTVVAGILYIDRLGLTHDVLNVAMLAFGMFSVTAIKLVFQAFESGKNRPLISITFNEALITSMMKSVGEADYDTKSSVDTRYGNEDKLFSAAAFVGRDNQLALAKLRMDLERATEHTANIRGVLEAGVPFNPRRVFGLLISHKILPVELESVWREVFSACSKAIHGGQVSDETAESIVRVGVKLIHAISLAGDTPAGIKH